jgi:hypothetical protein
LQLTPPVVFGNRYRTFEAGAKRAEIDSSAKLENGRFLKATDGADLFFSITATALKLSASETYGLGGCL